MLFCLIIYWHVNLQTKNMKFIIKYVKIKYKKSKLVLKKLNGLSTQDNIYYGMAVLWIWNNSFWIRIQLRLLNQLKRRITQRQLPSKGTFHCIFCKIKQKRIIFLLIFVWNRIETINFGSGCKFRIRIQNRGRKITSTMSPKGMKAACKTLVSTSSASPPTYNNFFGPTVLDSIL